MQRKNERLKSRNLCSSYSNPLISENQDNMKDKMDLNSSSLEHFRSQCENSIARNLISENSISNAHKGNFDTSTNDLEKSNIAPTDDLDYVENLKKRSTIFKESHFSEQHEKKNYENILSCQNEEETVSKIEENDVNINNLDVSIQVFNNSIRPKGKSENAHFEERINIDVYPLQNSCIYKMKNRKRKWISKKNADTLSPTLSISTDSLRKYISDVDPLPLSDIHLDSSSEVEEVTSQLDNNSGKSPQHFNDFEIPLIEKENFFPKKHETVGENGKETLIRSPSPSKNKESNILFITNLVRPFTVLQLKGLLSRTGKITDNGFWIDRIKSRCYVQYETEDEAIETRHALHGIRWPNSNPKCLNVDFGIKADMQKAQLLMKKNEDELVSLLKNEKILPVREWDVGKNKTFDAVTKEKNIKTTSKNAHENKKYSNRIDCEEKEKQYYRKENSYASNSPVRNERSRENDPPLRLLDDLFRKTQATPCIYWLPLTPEQIAEREIIRKKRMKDRQQRIHQTETERFKPYEKEKNVFHEIKLECGECELKHTKVRQVSRSKDKRWN